jgi:hypothetical protein
VRLHFFACAPRDPAQTPAARFRWVAAAELDNYRFPPANAALVNHLRKGDGGRRKAEEGIRNSQRGIRNSMDEDPLGGTS